MRQYERTGVLRHIRALVCDLDDTLVNTSKIIRECFRYAADQSGLDPVTDEDRVRIGGGISLLDIFRKKHPHLAHDDRLIMGLQDHFRKRQGEIHDELVEGYAGLKDTLAYLHGSGLRFGIVTTRASYVQDTIREVGIAPYVSAVVEGGHVVCQKPDPEGVHLCLRQMGLEPSEAAMLGDTKADIDAGKNAGLHSTIAVSYGIGGTDSGALGADHVIDSLPELVRLLG